MRARHRTTALAVALATFPIASTGYPPPSCTAKSAVPDIAFEAEVTTAGPYGEHWTVTLEYGEEASVAIHWTFHTPGHLTGTFLIEPQEVAKAADAAQFASLPQWIDNDRPAPLHQPDLRLDLQVNCRRHEVHLYDPARVENRGQVERFMAVWNAIFRQLPVQPKWK